ncbi:MAG: UDP-N-acetylmuramoyl-L-alanyl-D-glutamate--2,6-diaminopimelate ligase [Firmicutes bacterium]|nr:UDP-N-acetylmuramoyl-L-alanyl-D-glutamate--2,6-diaminopimelate ligase [Bacillota bacterium]MCL1953480.1 UDP-N-acetylmuramoyl-L-alanyl-D-glutamate--2,6-diaminopimelate ligase [Bacillota bacterium]
MQLSELALGYTMIGCDATVIGLCHESSRVKQGDLYFALQGGKYDGHDFVQSAIKNGAIAVVVQRQLQDCSVSQIIVDDSRTAMSKIANVFFGNASQLLKIVGITGTNGKTTVSHIVASILQSNGNSVAIIGTLGIIVNGKFWDSTKSHNLTTPDPIYLHKVFKSLVEIGVEYVVMEVSAHALFLNKLEGIKFECSVLTCFSRDHLDFFGTMQQYKLAKLKLFDPKFSKTAVVNIDDDLGMEIALQSNLPIISYGCNRPSDVFGIHHKMNARGLEYILNCVDNIVDINFKLPGLFNMYNTMAAASCAYVLGVPIKKIAIGISNTTRVDGRFNIINTDRFSVVIDYAHTDDGLSNLLSTVRQFAKGRIVTVFGCGGNRDVTKRPLMGLASAKHSDYTIITSDNPRFEEPNSIISQIEKGIISYKGAKYECIPDRRQAIKRALELANQDDIVVIAGKGAETTQEIAGEFLAHNDWLYVNECLYT